MSRSIRGSGPLRADQRHSGAKPRAAGTQRAASPRKPRRRRGGGRRGGGFGIMALLAGLIRLVMRVTWGVAWRVGAVGALVVGLAVAAIYQGLPPAATLVDGRARGSVTLMDRDGELAVGETGARELAGREDGDGSEPTGDDTARAGPWPGPWRGSPCRLSTCSRKHALLRRHAR